MIFSFLFFSFSPTKKNHNENPQKLYEKHRQHLRRLPRPCRHRLRRRRRRPLELNETLIGSKSVINIKNNKTNVPQTKIHKKKHQNCSNQTTKNHQKKPQDFTLDFYFRQFWTDPRLAYRKRPGVETLSVGSEFIKNIWVPDTFFVNEKQSYFHIATTSNEFIRIHHSGSITRSIR